MHRLGVLCLRFRVLLLLLLRGRRAGHTRRRRGLAVREWGLGGGLR